MYIDGLRSRATTMSIQAILGDLMSIKCDENGQHVRCPECKAFLCVTDDEAMTMIALGGCRWHDNYSRAWDCILKNYQSTEISQRVDDHRTPLLEEISPEWLPRSMRKGKPDEGR
jgi:hypothetical protein